MAFTEFYTDFATGSNINAGDDKTVVTSTNGDWSTVTNIFTAAAGTPFSASVAGDFASVYLDGATVAVYIARIVTVNGGGASLTLDTTAIIGTAPTTGANGRTCTVGGKWKGPNAAVGFPFTLMAGVLTNVAGDSPRVNMKNTSTYAITANIAGGAAGPVRIEGYTTTPGDGGRATIDGGVAGASYVLLAGTANWDYEGIIFQNNGATGNASLVSNGGTEATWRRCVFSNALGTGLNLSAATLVIECEAFLCNGSNTAALAGFLSSVAGSHFIRCISHDNAGSNSSGFRLTIAGMLVECIADTNGEAGFTITATTLGTIVKNCDAYNNTTDGINLANAAATDFYIENCNLVKNGGWGINGSGAGGRTGYVVNCGFGSGSQVNVAGSTTGLKAMKETGSVTYPAGMTPWVAPTTGNFSVNSALAQGVGRGAFTQTQSGYGGTVAYPTIGSGQPLAPAGFGGHWRLSRGR